MTISYKCKHLVQIPPVTINDVQLERVSSFKLLGLNITDALSFQEHTEYIFKKANTRLYFLKRLRYSGLRSDELITYYTTFI